MVGVVPMPPLVQPLIQPNSQSIPSTRQRHVLLMEQVVKLHEVHEVMRIAHLNHPPQPLDHQVGLVGGRRSPSMTMLASRMQEIS